MTTRRMVNFLIVFDHDTGRQISLEEFYNTAEAIKAYSEREEQYEDDARVEVVLLGAGSIRAIRVTHSNYFRDAADPFANLLASFGMDPLSAAQEAEMLWDTLSGYLPVSSEQ